LWWPAIGALALGIIGYFVPRVFGVGYDTIGAILNGELAWKVLLVVMIAKFAALVISLGSGTSGGLLAPTFMWSAAMGGLFAMIGNHVFPNAHLSPGAFALVAMGAVFGAASRATFSFIIFAFEITRDYNSVLPLMLVAVIADGIAMLFMPRSSIMTEKLARRGLRVHQDYEADVLTQVTVAETMEKDPPLIAAGTKVGEVAERIARHDPAVARYEALLILDNAGKLAGIVTRGDILRALDEDTAGTMKVEDAGSKTLVVTYPDELVSDAAAKLLRFNIGRMPVVERADEKKVVGYLNRAAILAARTRRMHDESFREPGWLPTKTRTAR
jgi:CBS domain-containing protein